MRYHMCRRFNNEQVTFGTGSGLQSRAALLLCKGLKYPFAGGHSWGGERCAQGSSGET